jgi:DNA replication protein DnaC
VGARGGKLLIVDELGYLPLEPDAAHLFFQLVSRRYETGAMLITSNRSLLRSSCFGHDRRHWRKKMSLKLMSC